MNRRLLKLPSFVKQCKPFPGVSRDGGVRRDSGLGEWFRRSVCQRKHKRKQSIQGVISSSKGQVQFESSAAAETSTILTSSTTPDW